MRHVGSVQSAPPSGKVRQGWVEADRAGYALYQSALLKYGMNYYSESSNEHKTTCLLTRLI
jgi:hypothetical protein